MDFPFSEKWVTDENVSKYTLPLGRRRQGSGGARDCFERFSKVYNVDIAAIILRLTSDPRALMKSRSLNGERASS
jgi:hypothetical protein